MIESRKFVRITYLNCLVYKPQQTLSNEFVFAALNLKFKLGDLYGSKEVSPKDANAVMKCDNDLTFDWIPTDVPVNLVSYVNIPTLRYVDICLKFLHVAYYTLVFP